MIECSIDVPDILLGNKTMIESYVETNLKIIIPSF